MLFGERWSTTSEVYTYPNADDKELIMIEIQGNQAIKLFLHIPVKFVGIVNKIIKCNRFMSWRLFPCVVSFIMFHIT